jgi:hydroxymethylbilane synthase
VPIGTFARIQEGKLVMDAMVGMPDGTQLITGSIAGDPADAEALGIALAGTLKDQGAEAILATIRLAPPA